MSLSDGNKSVHDNSRKSWKINSFVMAIIFALIVTGWMLSGVVQRHLSELNVVQDQKEEAAPSGTLFHVRAETYYSESRQANIIIRGRTEVDTRVQVKAQISGVVEEIPQKKGARVNKGDLLCRIETAEKEANLLQAKAKLTQAESDYSANIALARKGHTAQLRVTSYKAALDAARAELKRAELNLSRTKVQAPFSGFVEEQQAEVGDYLTVGMPCATLVDLNPLIVVGHVSELEVKNLKAGMKAQARLLTGEMREGTLSFISPSADKDTRTFRIEVEIQNNKASLRDGVTADINIPLSLTKAHRFTPAILVLSDNGQIGVRTLDRQNMVKFMPVKLLADDAKGVWVGGLPDEVRIITVGQEYVMDGQKVQVTETNKEKSKQTVQGS